MLFNRKAFMLSFLSEDKNHASVCPNQIALFEMSVSSSSLMKLLTTLLS
jgi:hypothetical protein